MGTMMRLQSRNPYYESPISIKEDRKAGQGISLSFSVQIRRLHALLEEALEAKLEEDLALGPGSASASSTSSVSSWDSVNGW